MRSKVSHPSTPEGDECWGKRAGDYVSSHATCNTSCRSCTTPHSAFDSSYLRSPLSCSAVIFLTASLYSKNAVIILNIEFHQVDTSCSNIFCFSPPSSRIAFQRGRRIVLEWMILKENLRSWCTGSGMVCLLRDNIISCLC